ncbi:hypothetical protein FOCC_FOCC000555 [Frankliniella occidentalis]|nr:hypothetical protein FOCC_FOCC000555 [Frankliniella occidentalis]
MGDQNIANKSRLLTLRKNTKKGRVVSNSVQTQQQRKGLARLCDTSSASPRSRHRRIPGGVQSSPAFAVCHVTTGIDKQRIAIYAQLASSALPRERRDIGSLIGAGINATRSAALLGLNLGAKATGAAAKVARAGIDAGERVEQGAIAASRNALETGINGARSVAGALGNGLVADLAKTGLNAGEQLGNLGIDTAQTVASVAVGLANTGVNAAESAANINIQAGRNATDLTADAALRAIGQKA